MNSTNTLILNDAYEQILRNLADRYADGHVSVMKYTTNWRVMLGTPDSRCIHNVIPSGKTKTEALRNAIAYYENDTEQSIEWLEAMADVIDDYISKGLNPPKGQRLYREAKERMDDLGAI